MKIGLREIRHENVGWTELAVGTPVVEFYVYANELSGFTKVGNFLTICHNVWCCIMLSDGRK
jgi:hypothetical protein